MPLPVFSSVSEESDEGLLPRLPRPESMSVVVHEKLVFFPVSVVVNVQDFCPCTLDQVPPDASHDRWLCWSAPAAEAPPMPSDTAIAAAATNAGIRFIRHIPSAHTSAVRRSVSQPFTFSAKRPGFPRGLLRLHAESDDGGRPAIVRRHRTTPPRPPRVRDHRVSTSLSSDPPESAGTTSRASCSWAVATASALGSVRPGRTPVGSVPP